MSASLGWRYYSLLGLMTAASGTGRTHLAAFLGVLLLCTTITAQTNTGEISGVVRDVQGGALPGARVIAEHVDSGVRVEYPADEAGRYHLVSLRVGMYVIIVELQGFCCSLRSGVLVLHGLALVRYFAI